MVNARTKGANGEREAGKWLQEHFNLTNTPERNLEQVRSGGFDLIGFEPFAVEVKRCQALNKRAWWSQATSACPEGMFPLVMYRQNRKQWKFLISAHSIGVEQGFIQLEYPEFILWARNRVNRSLIA